MKSCVHISREISIQRTETARSKLPGLCPHTQSPADLFLGTTGWLYFSLPMCPSSLGIACVRHLACAATILLFLNTFLIFQFTFRCTIVWYWQWLCVVGRSTSILHSGTSVQLPHRTRPWRRHCHQCSNTGYATTCSCRRRPVLPSAER